MGLESGDHDGKCHAPRGCLSRPRRESRESGALTDVTACVFGRQTTMGEDLALVGGKITRTAGFVTAVTATFAGTECFAESMRNTKDPMNAAFGGLAAGLLMGMYTKNPAKMVALGVGCAACCALVDGFGNDVMSDRARVYARFDPLRYGKKEA